MEFKGTKGKWNQNMYAVFIGDEEKMGNEICRLHSGTRDYMLREQASNALLISKAPEMLEMLKQIADGKIRPREYESEEKIIRKLIREATEL